MQNEEILDLLGQVVHPETGTDIVSGGIVEDVKQEGDKISLTLHFQKSRDPFLGSIKKQVLSTLENSLHINADKISITIKEGSTPQSQPSKPKAKSTLEGIGKIIAVASGKGGVGKSTVTANLAVSLHNLGYNVGVLDADIYGPSQPKMFGVEDYQPVGFENEGTQYLMPAESRGIKINSIGFFIDPANALIWRGPMATNALRQLIHQTWWEGLDFLLIDLPPGTGDVHLSIVSEMQVDGAVIVSTPQQVAVADVRRGINMFKTPKIEIPVLGVIENMAWFTPAELPENKYYIFGHGGARELAASEGVDFLGEIPIIQSIMDGAEQGDPAVTSSAEVENYYREICQKIVEKLTKNG